MLKDAPVSCIILFLAHLCSYVLDHVKPRSEVQVKQAQVEATTNLALDQGKPQCIPPIFLNFWFSINIYITICVCIKFIGFVWHRSCIKNSFLIILVYHCYHSYRSLVMARHRHICR
jgi:hypothetical protein